jgi:hypothetical protein
VTARSLQAVLLLLALVGPTACPSPPPAAPEPPTPEPLPEDPDPCQAPLALEPDRLHVLPLSEITLHPHGGSGRYRFELVEDGSGALVNELTGAYLAGDAPGTTDRIAVSDLGCEQAEVVATVEVVDLMVVEPREVWIRAGGSFTPTVSAGSGQHGCSLAQAFSGASLDTGCGYHAGSTLADDVIEVTDLLTGQVETIAVHVVVDARLRAQPDRLFMPLSSLWSPQIDGGSGFFDLVDPSGIMSYGSDDRMEAVAPGRTTVEVTDRYTGITTSFELNVVEQLQAPVHRSGETIMDGKSASADIDGDGFTDVVMGVPEASVEAFRSGAAYIYRGTAQGLDPTPARVLSPPGMEDFMGYSLVLRDFDRDGSVDLAVGVNRSDSPSPDIGAVWIYPGMPGRFFADEPSQMLTAERDGDLYGFAMAACDVNGDGWEDLAVGAIYAEDRSAASVRWTAGALHLHLGRASGFDAEADQILYGRIPDGSGGWQHWSNLQMGRAVAGADANGDGLCDIATGAWPFDPPEGGTYSDNGSVFLFLGQGPGTLPNGGLTPEPVAAWAPRITGDLDIDDRNARLGYNLAMGDLDGDGMAEVVASSWYHNATPPSRQRHGALRVFRGEAFDPNAPSGWRAAEDADWSYVGDGGWDYAGFDAQVVDANGDGVPDLAVASLRDERGGGTADAGELAIFEGSAGSLPAAAPTRTLAGLEAEGFFGQQFAPLPDMDGDGWAEWMVLAARMNDFGIDAGRPYYVESSTGALTALDYPSNASGHQLGRAVAPLGDLNGDGWDEVVMAGPYADGDLRGRQGGDGWIYAGTPSGIDPQPVLSLREFHGGGDDWDLFGFDADAGGDFNGDGLPDLLVAARLDEVPIGGFNGDYANPDDCDDRIGDVGAVYVFLGRSDGLFDSRPGFVWFGPSSDDEVLQVAGGADVDGDGYDDFVAGSMYRDRSGGSDVGGLSVVRGRASDPAGTTVICASGFDLLAPSGESNRNLARDLTMLGDIDGDGCSEFAAGAYREDLGDSDRGVLRVFFGFGPGCNAAAPRYLAMSSMDRWSRTGYAVAGGQDVDGDGINDLVVTADNFAWNGARVGAVWLVTGAELLQLPTEPWSDDQLPSALWPIAINAPGHMLLGDRSFGESLALVPGYEADGRAAVLVGHPRRPDPTGQEIPGGASLHRFSTDPATWGLDPQPAALLVGESFDSGGAAQVGYSVAARRSNGRPTAVVGAPWSDQLGLDVGTAYVLDLGP